eukprot:jgi/Tetstr1/456722/TSEL_043419.t1
MGSKTKKKMNTSTMWLAKGMAKMMISNKDTEILANNLKKLPPQRTPSELDRLQHSAKGLPIFKALRKATKKSRELCRVLKLRSRIASKRPTGPLMKFGADTWGPVGVTFIGGFRYVFGMTDYYSVYGSVVFMKSKDEAPRNMLLVALLDNGGVGSTSDASRLEEITEAHRRVVDETDDVEELEIEEAPQTAEELELGSQRPTLELTQLETNEGTHDGGQEESIVQRAERDPYPARSRRAPGQWWVVHPENPNDEAAAMMAAAFAAVTQGVDEPITLKQALSGAFEEQWTQAAESEFNSLEKQGTWVVCELPEERTVIPSKWVFEVKYNADGSIARFKADWLSKAAVNDMASTMQRVLHRP